MELTGESIDLYVRHAFAGMARVLDRLDDDTVNQRPGDWGTNSVAGLVVHCCELAPSWFAMPGLGRDSDRDRQAEFAARAKASLAEQAHIERQDSLDFDQYLARYFAG